MDADKTEVLRMLLNEAGTYSGRPVDVAELSDGSLLISDISLCLYRITYEARQPND